MNIERLRRIRKEVCFFLSLALHFGFAQGAVRLYSTPFAKHKSIGHPPRFFHTHNLPRRSRKKPTPLHLPHAESPQSIKQLNEKVGATSPHHKKFLISFFGLFFSLNYWQRAHRKLSNWAIDEHSNKGCEGVYKKGYSTEHPLLIAEYIAQFQSFMPHASLCYLRLRYAANASAKAPKIAAQVAGSGIAASLAIVTYNFVLSAEKEASSVSVILPLTVRISPKVDE